MTYTDYTGCDHDLFLALNFDGGPATDRLMLAVSGTWMWVPLYLLICYLVLRGDRPALPAGGRFADRADWLRLLLFAVLLGATIGLSDMVAGIFKANGLLGNLLPDFSPRCRPMYTPSLEGSTSPPTRWPCCGAKGRGPANGSSTRRARRWAAATAPSRPTPPP